MLSAIGRSRTLIVISALGASLLLPPQAKAWGQSDNKAAADVQGKLDKKQFKNVKADVDGSGIATLTGTVDLYEYKMDAQKRASKVKGVKAVRNDIEVAGPSVPDQELQQKLVDKIAYDRVGYGTTPFNAISVNVQNGIVTLGGSAYSDVDKDSAVALAATTPGVKEVIDNVESDPVSIMDDQIRLAVARAIYRSPTLSKYAIDPVKPIRIQVKNGNVSLYGVVISKADKDLAFIRANGVSGVFSVKNYLQVAGQPAEEPKKE